MDDRARQLRRRLRACSCEAASTLGKRLRGETGSLRELEAAVRRAELRASERRAAAPRAALDLSLPIAAKAEEIEAALRERPALVVCGETGSGKSTQLPLICLRAGRGLRGLIGHTQPRRIAARTISRRLAEEMGVELGREVGFKVRFDDSTNPRTYIKVMTDGVLLAELRRDRGLLAYDTIIIDEAHERSLNIDFLLGYLKRLLDRRRDLRVVVTSATLDPEKLSRHFDGAPVIEVSGRMYPVEVRYRPPESGAEVEPTRPIVDAVEEAAALGPGDVLVFLPGEREIREATAALRESGGAAAKGAEVLPLYARLSAADQLRAFQSHERRRIILATNVAETSVTVPGVHYVVDTGLARISRYGSRSRVQGLEIEPISRASADQRAGRCGRVADGVCIRLYAEDDYQHRVLFTDPEIVRSNLAGVLLRMKALRLGEPREFPFVDPPSPRRIRDAHDALVELGAIDAEGKLTEIGRELATVPVDPRLGRMILAGASEGSLREVLIIAACLASRDPRERPLEARDRADAAHASFADPSSDFLALLRIWEESRRQAAELSARKYRKWCGDSFLSWRGLREWEDLHEQLGRIVRGLGYRQNDKPAGYDAVHQALLAGLLGNIGLRGERYEYQGAHGAEFFLHPGSGLFERKPRWVMAAEMVRTDRPYARMVAGIRPEWLETLGAHLLERSYSTPSWDDRAAAPVVVERVALYGLRLPSKRRVLYGQINPAHAREIFLRQGLVEGAFRPHADFVEHNERMILETRRLEAKARRRDLQGEAGARFDFFDRRVPAHVWSGKSFDRWRHKAEAQHPRLLFMCEQDLIVWAEELPSEVAFPDAVQIAGDRRELEYHYEPGEPDDGVVLQLPLAAFADLDEAKLDWLVPGLVRDRAVEMLRGLPKEQRRAIGPVPSVVEEFLASGPDPALPLVTSLASFVGRSKGIEIRAADLRARAVPGHLRPKLVVTGPDGAVLAEGRDLLELKQRVSGEVEDAINAGQSEVPPRGGEVLGLWRGADLDDRPLFRGGGHGIPGDH
ncbi:MAG: ATP-dependent RNA helicase HrpA [Phycisphaerales bacterium]|nr:ATP-dependent RNA helicase HrpA [Phycisphaerales bacterium]